MSGTTVLVIDRDANARTALDELLRGEGYEVQVAADAASAMALADRVRPGVVLAEAQPLAAQNLALRDRLQGVVPTPRLILMSSVPPDASLPRIACFLQKPIDLDRLFQVVAGDGSCDHQRSVCGHGERCTCR